MAMRGALQKANCEATRWEVSRHPTTSGTQALGRWARPSPRVGKEGQQGQAQSSLAHGWALDEICAEFEICRVKIKRGKNCQHRRRAQRRSDTGGDAPTTKPHTGDIPPSLAAEPWIQSSGGPHAGSCRRPVYPRAWHAVQGRSEAGSSSALCPTPNPSQPTPGPTAAHKPSSPAAALNTGSECENFGG